MKKLYKAVNKCCSSVRVDAFQVPTYCLNFCLQLKDMPWLHFVTSGPVWAIVIANFCADWGGFTLITNTPTFYKEVLLVDIESVSNH